MKKPNSPVSFRLPLARFARGLALSSFIAGASLAHAALLFHYDFDEASGPALDSGMAPEADANLAGSAVRIAGGPTGTGYALDLASGGAASAYATPGVSSKLGSPLSKLTVVAWINLQADQAVNDRIVDNLTATTGFGFLFWNTGQSASAAKIGFLANNTTSGANSTTGIDLNNKWVMVAVTYDGTVGTSNVRFYKGDPATSVAQFGSTLSYNKGAIAVSANELRIGSTPASTSDRTPPAWIDNVRIYDTVLSQSQLEAIRAEDFPFTPASISGQPASRTAYEGVSSVSISATVSGAEPVSKQWYFNGTSALDGATNATLTLTNITAGLAGNYSLMVSNAYNTNSVWSSNAVLTVLPLQNTVQMTNIWNLLPADRSYITYDITNNNERSLAFNPASSNLLVVSRANGFTVAVLDPQTGAEKNFMDTSGIPADLPGVSLGLSMIGAGADGVIYGAGLVVNAANTPFYVYRWADDSSSSLPVLVFAGDPGSGPAPGLRWGDSFAVRGAGAATQILLAPNSGTNVVLLQTVNGYDFQTEVPPSVISVTGVPSGFAQAGIAFGPSTNTFWAKSGTNNLYLIQFDLSARTGTVLQSYPNSAYGLTALRGVGTDTNQQWLAGVAVEGPGDNARLYDISNLSIGPVLADQELFATRNANTQLGAGLASAAIGGGYVFTLDCNNGIKAFALNSSYHSTPVISLIGSATMTNEVNTVFVDPGALGSENGSALPVVISGSVDTNTAGMYVLTYTTTDPVGNQASTNRTVYVVPVNNGPSGPGVITNSISGSSVTLNWPSGQGWRLVYQTNSLSVGLNPATNAWHDVTGTGDGSYSFTLDPSLPAVFYRLVYP